MPKDKVYKVKLQRSIVTAFGTSQLLIYTEDQSILYQMDLSHTVRKLFGNKHKIYMTATHDTTTGLLTLDRVIPDQDW